MKHRHPVVNFKKYVRSKETTLTVFCVPLPPYTTRTVQQKNETLVGKSRVGISHANTLHTRVTMNVQLWGGFSEKYTHTKEFRHPSIKR